MQGLQAALELYFQDGVEVALARHRTLSRAVKEGAKALGLDLFGEGLDDNWTVTAIRAPEAVDADAISDRIRADFGCVLAPGPGPAEGEGLPDRALRLLQRARHHPRARRARDDARVARPPREARRGRRRRRERVPGVARSVRVLVTEPLSAQGLRAARDRLPGRRAHRPRERRSLAAEIAPYDALIIRSATQVTADVLEAATNLKVVARAGIGLDNVDVEAATRRGVMVVNAPQSNIISAAEQAMALLLAQARNIPQAHAALKQRGVGAHEVGGRRARRQDDRARRARPGRRARRDARRGVRDAGDRVRPLRERRPRQGDGRRRDADARGAARAGRLRLDPPAAHARDRGPDR